MAGADYRKCDVCGGKAFYDANLNYDFDKKDKDGNHKLGYVGSMKVLCDECSKTYQIFIIKCRLDDAVIYGENLAQDTDTLLNKEK